MNSTNTQSEFHEFIPARIDRDFTRCERIPLFMSRHICLDISVFSLFLPLVLIRFLSHDSINTEMFFIVLRMVLFFMEISYSHTLFHVSCASS